MKKEICPICGSGTLRRKEGNKEFNYKGKSKVVNDYVTYVCDFCHEAIVDNESLRRAGRELTEFKREVDGFLKSKQIKRIREELGFTQEQMAKYLGGGVKAFARYESGSICQSRAMDNLLRVLQKFPSMIKFLHQDEYVVSYEMKEIFAYKIYSDRQFYVTGDCEDSAKTREAASGS